MYRQQRERSASEEGARGSLEEYLHSLEVTVEVARLRPEDVARAAQLTQKTNQFNVTTHRYSEQQVQDRAASTTSEVFVVRSGDRFGDHGTVGLLIVDAVDGRGRSTRCCSAAA